MDEIKNLKAKQKAEMAEAIKKQKAMEKAEKEAAKAKAREEKEAAKAKEKAEKQAAKEDERSMRLAQKEAERQQRADDNKVEMMSKLEEEIGEVEAVSFYSTLELNEEGMPYHTVNNLYKYIDRFYNNSLEEFSSRVYVDGKELNANKITEVAMRCENFFDGWYTEDKTRSVINLSAERKKYNAIKNKIESFGDWDGVKRVETFFIDRLFVEDTKLNREMSFKWLYAMIMRIYFPGCDFDHCLTLTGKQKFGKTKTLIMLTRVLSDEGKSFTDLTCSLKLDDKDNVLKLNRCVICFFDESDAVKYSNNDKFKVFVTANEFHARRPYDVDDMTFPSHMVIAVSTNDEKFLTDVTSEHERRHWILDVGATTEKPRTVEEWNETKLNTDETLRQIWCELRHYIMHEEDAPFDVKNGLYNELTQDNNKVYVEIQKKYKTRDDDYVTLNAIDSILLSKYKNVRHSTLESMWSDFMDRDAIGKEAEIDKIPIKLMLGMINKITRKSNSTEYLTSILSNIEGWEVRKRVRYNQGKYTCLVRSNTPSDCTEEVNPTVTKDEDDVQDLHILDVDVDENNKNDDSKSPVFVEDDSWADEAMAEIEKKKGNKSELVMLKDEPIPDFNKICKWETSKKVEKIEEDLDWVEEAAAEIKEKYGDGNAIL